MRTFRSLRHRNFRLYFLGQLISLIGSWTQMTALLWLAHSQTGQARWPAFLAAAQIGPTFLLGPYGGWLADRLPRKKLIAITQSAFLICAVVLLTLHWSGSLTVWAMLAVMLAHGVVQAIDVPARLAFVSQLVDRRNLSNAIALNSLLFNTARAIGPAIAGILLGTLGANACFIFNAVSYLALFAALRAMRLPIVAFIPGSGSPGGIFRVLLGHPGVVTFVIVAGLIAIGGWPLLALLPYYTEKQLGLAEDAYGTLLSAVGIGALIGAIVAATAGNETRRIGLILGGMFCVVAALLTLTLSLAFWVAMICCGVFGFGMILFFANGQSEVQLRTKDSDRGRVMGVWAMMLSAGVPMGNLVFGPAADAYGVETVLVIQAAVVALAIAVILLRRPLRHQVSFTHSAGDSVGPPARQAIKDP